MVRRTLVRALAEEAAGSPAWLGALTETQRRYILAVAQGALLREVGARFGVDKSTVSRVLWAGLGWRG